MSKMSASQKEAMAQGREEGHIVRRYLSSLGKTTKARPVSIDVLRKRLAYAEEMAGSDDPIVRLSAAQQRIDAAAAIKAAELVDEADSLEDDFVKVAASFSERRGTTWAAWRAVGVPSGVLRRAGVR